MGEVLVSAGISMILFSAELCQSVFALTKTFKLKDSSFHSMLLLGFKDCFESVMLCRATNLNVTCSFRGCFHVHAKLVYLIFLYTADNSKLYLLTGRGVAYYVYNLETSTSCRNYDTKRGKKCGWMQKQNKK